MGWAVVPECFVDRHVPLKGEVMGVKFSGSDLEERLATGMGSRRAMGSHEKERSGGPWALGSKDSTQEGGAARRHRGQRPP